MLKHHLPHLFDDDPNLRDGPTRWRPACYELVSFLTDVLGVRDTGARFDGR